MPKIEKMKDMICDYCFEKYPVESGSFNRKMYTKRVKGYKCYCSKDCEYNAKGLNNPKEVECLSCKVKFFKKMSELKKTANSFCSQSCAATYNNTHKTKGTRRSKLEVWLEEQLKNEYPTLNVLYSDKTTINSELDIYFPSLNLAIELNGLFHYEPIFGETKLNQIQNNDNRKFQACLEHAIELCIIDTSNQKYFKPSTSQKYFDVIKHLIDLKLKIYKVLPVGADPTTPQL